MSDRRRAGAVLALVLLAASGACSSRDPYATLPEPDPVEIEETTTTLRPDLTGVLLAPVMGTTSTSIGLGPGPLTIVGRVEGPEGPVGGALVRITRLVGDGQATATVPTAADGTWNLENVQGGRYRIRAWRAPDLVTPRSVVLFVERAPTRAIDVRLEPVGGVRVDAAMAPDPPVVDEPANLKVRVAQRTVDDDGVIRDAPVPAIRVGLSGSGAWSISSANPAMTGTDGSATFQVVCRRGGDQPLLATVDGSGTYALAVPACLDPAATTTTSTSTSTTGSTTTTTGSTTSTTSSP